MKKEQLAILKRMLKKNITEPNNGQSPAEIRAFNSYKEGLKYALYLVNNANKGLLVN
jgi:hypothetical protein